VTASLAAEEVTLDADTALEELYAAHWRRLVRLAVLLLRDQGAAEEVVQDAFVAMHGRWRSLRDPDKAQSNLRKTVV
jgi:DNA-directed RNA polymerase specialized sigma24 family protein